MQASNLRGARCHRTDSSAIDVAAESEGVHVQAVPGPSCAFAAYLGAEMTGTPGMGRLPGASVSILLRRSRWSRAP